MSPLIRWTEVCSHRIWINREWMMMDRRPFLTVVGATVAPVMSTMGITEPTSTPVLAKSRKLGPVLASYSRINADGPW